MITEIGIEVGVPAPKMRVVYAYPYEDMDVGDSFAVPLEARAKVLNANYRAGKRLGRVFTAKTEGETVRVWRTA
jgi:predicted hydrocarbon binding protein